MDYIKRIALNRLRRLRKFIFEIQTLVNLMIAGEKREARKRERV